MNDAPAQDALPTVDLIDQTNGDFTAELTFAVSRDADDALIGAAEFFCGELEKRTNGAITAKVTRSIAPDADLLTGKAQLALLNKKRQFEFCEPLAATATPFLYNSYSNFTMRANAGSTIGVLGYALRQKKLVPLSAYYQGSLHLLSDSPLNGYQYFEKMTVIISDDAEMRSAFGRLVGYDGAVIVHDTDEKRLEQFLQGDGNAAEISPGTLSGMKEDFDHTVYLTASYHNITPVWLLARAEFMDGLSSSGRAEVAELCAYMTNMIDDAYTCAEDDFLDGRRESNIIIYTEFSSVRNRALNTLPELDADADDQKRLARDLLEIMRRTA